VSFGQNVDFLSSTIWTEAKDVKVSGDYAYVTFFSGLGIFDISDLTEPELISTIGFQFNSLNMALSGNYLYIANEEAGLKVVDVTNPYIPSVTAQRPLNATAVDVSVYGSYAFVATLNSGMHIVDISGTLPMIVSVFDTPGEAWGVKAIGSYAYIADGDSLMIVDVFDPVNPFRVGAYRHASEAVRAHPRAISDVFAEQGIEGLVEIPAIGSSIASLIREYVRSGRISLHDRLVGEEPSQIGPPVPIMPSTLPRTAQQLSHSMTVSTKRQQAPTIQIEAIG